MQNVTNGHIVGSSISYKPDVVLQGTPTKWRLVPATPRVQTKSDDFTRVAHPIVVRDTMPQKKLVLLPSKPAHGMPPVDPKYNTHLKFFPASGDCVCIFCGFRFTPQRTTSAAFLSDAYAGLDYCPACCGQGGIIRAHGVELARLPQIRAAVIDLITTQNKKSHGAQNALDAQTKIDPVWDTLADSVQ